MNANRSFGSWLRQRRKALDLTQPELAEQVAYSVTTLQKIEADERRPSKQMAERLADVLAISLEERGAFVAFARRAESSLPVPLVPSAVARPSHNLPSQSTPFIGREYELAQIADRLANPACRLLTLVGPGGIGKTRLAIEAAKRLCEVAVSPGLEATSFADGIRFVDLQPINASENLITTIANTLGILLAGPQEPRDQLLNYLSVRETLLLLDNFEQLLEGIDLLTDILKAAPGVKLLVTSREALNIQEEWLWRVTGLRVPDSQAETTIESYSAVRLFAEHTRRIQQDFTLIGQETSVIRICQLVDGMPLALELAAGWTKFLSCAEIAHEIKRSLDFLTTTLRNAPERHRSMQAVFDSSWRLLTEAEREAFPRLSVFRGGFRREAAEQVAGASLPVLAGLVNKSFLRVSGSGRYKIHELTRQYGEEHLAAVMDTKTETQNRHCAYYAGFLHERQTALRGPTQATALDEIETELDNVRLSWQWAVEHGMGREIYQSMHSLYVFCHIRAQAVEGERLFEMTVNRFEHDDSPMLAYLLLARISAAGQNGRTIGADQFLRAIGLAYTFWTDDEIAIHFGVYFDLRKELVSKNLFDDQRFELVVRDFLKRFRTHDKPWGATFMLLYLGKISNLFNRKLDEAERYFRESLDGFLQLGDRWASAWSTLGLAFVSDRSQKYREALQWWQQHQDVCAEVDDRGGNVLAPAFKARIVWKLQDHNTARLYVAQGLKLHLEFGSQFFHLSQVIHSLVDVLVSESRNERAVELLSFLRQLAGQTNASDVVAEANEKLAPLAPQLPPDLYQQALERGKTLNLRTILEQLLDELSG